MTISNELLLAILSMDSYNRGYNPGILGLPDVKGTLVGNASIIFRIEDIEGFADQAEAAGFYAVAYNVGGTMVDGVLTGGEIVISYRGTDEFKDVWNGWTSILGDIPIQAELAVKFYLAVKAANLGKTITLTGHSLGGALAGFVGAMYGDAIPLTNGFHA